MILEDEGKIIVKTEWIQGDFHIGSWYQVMGIYTNGKIEAKICRNVDRLDRHLYRCVLDKLKEMGY